MAAGKTDDLSLMNPFIRISKELFRHAKVHLTDVDSSDKDFDRLVAGVHIDNALELYLKFYALQNNMNVEKAGVPDLIGKLQQVLPELSTFGPDLKHFHSVRNGCYHIGVSVDEKTLVWAINRISQFFAAVEKREQEQNGNGGA